MLQLMNLGGGWLCLGAAMALVFFSPDAPLARGDRVINPSGSPRTSSADGLAACLWAFAVIACASANQFKDICGCEGVQLGMEGV